MDQWLSNLTNWLVGLVTGFFSALGDFIHDGALWVFDSILQGLASGIAAIPAPSFMQNGLNLGSLLSPLPPFAFYVIGHLQLGNALAIVSAGVGFRLLRKFLTLFQW